MCSIWFDGYLYIFVESENIYCRPFYLNQSAASQGIFFFFSEKLIIRPNKCGIFTSIWPHMRLAVYCVELKQQGYFMSDWAQTTNVASLLGFGRVNEICIVFSIALVYMQRLLMILYDVYDLFMLQNGFFIASRSEILHVFGSNCKPFGFFFC